MADSSGLQPRIAVIWVNYGLYHIARARALGRLTELHAIELTGFQRRYQWIVRSDDEPFRRHTISQGAWEDQWTPRLTRDLWKTLSRCSPDVVLVAGYTGLPFLAAAFWARLRGKTAILMSESNEGDYPRKGWRETIKRALVRSLYQGAVVGGKRAADYIGRLGVSRDRVGLFYDVVDNALFAEGTDACRRSAKGKDFLLPPHYFLCVARLDPAKNLHGLLHAYAQYVAGGGAWDLVLVGDGPMQAELADAIQRLGLERRATMAGFKNGREILPFFAFASCFILPSVREPWGLVVNEALNAGLPVLVSDRCGCSDDLVVQGENGYIFDPMDREQLVQHMIAMSSMPVPQREEMGRRSREIVARYSPERFADEVLRVVSAVRGQQLSPAGDCASGSCYPVVR